MSSIAVREKTRKEVVKYEHIQVLDIKNFSQFIPNTKKSASLTHAVFELGDECEWFMIVSLENDHLVICLIPFTDSNERVPDCEFSIINSNGENCNVETKCEDLFSNFSLRFSIQLSVINKETFLPNNQLTLQCKLTGFVTVNLSEQLGSLKSPKTNLEYDFGALLQNGQSADVTLVCKGEKFNAHKLILAARSSVFAAMFNHEMKEKENSCVEIIDMEKEILKEMLKYMYTDELSNLEKEATGLLAAADMYDLQSLKIECEKLVLNQLSIENAADILDLADVYSAHQLKENTIQFIRSNKTEVVETAEWKDLMKERSDLTAEVFEVESRRLINSK